MAGLLRRGCLCRAGEIKPHTAALYMLQATHALTQERIMNVTANLDRVRADQERRRSGAATKVQGAKLKAKHNRSVAKRQWKKEF